MTNMVRKHQTDPTNKLRSSSGIHGDSRSISKIQPKIRIIHIFAPEIIKTDVANFRELVQRLTGKPEKKKTTQDSISTSYTDTKPPRVMEAFDNTTTAPDDQSYDYNKDNCFGVDNYDQNHQDFLGEFDGVNDCFMDTIREFSYAPMEQDRLQHQHQHQHQLLQFEENLNSISY